jgi:hypothetical protein
MRKLFLLGLSFVCLAFQCGVKKSDCKNVACTQVFVSVGVEVMPKQTQDIGSYSSISLLESTGEVLHTQQGSDLSFGNTFVVADDSHIGRLGFKSSHKIIFQLIKADSIVAEESFVVGFDCCHIQKLSGVERIDVN